ncbi:hypothetical protein GCM10027404_12850 [Arthrobacter tumbae]|uniref:hypothetical protein n=1 Tax=Arthrobacter tumbae TaxID=163874 RepID=UPI00195E5581|nr:hypothetical protein [Arthrobacter tumbae]MBM7782568.1 hypothetical protein [Arthrobacter tumbae]
MNCDDLAATGFGAGVVVLFALITVGAGFLLLFYARARRRSARVSHAAIALTLLILCSGLAGVGGLPTAHAAPSDCAGSMPGPNEEVRATQIVTITGLAPGVAPAPIEGVVVNESSSTRYIEAVTVSIISVTKAVGAAAGTCDVTDYNLFDVAMPVDRVLRPAEAAEFSGASIGFSNKSVNQDACKKALVNLRYDPS